MGLGLLKRPLESAGGKASENGGKGFVSLRGRKTCLGLQWASRAYKMSSDGCPLGFLGLRWGRENSDREQRWQEMHRQTEPHSFAGVFFIRGRCVYFSEAFSHKSRDRPPVGFICWKNARASSQTARPSYRSDRSQWAGASRGVIAGCATHGVKRDSLTTIQKYRIHFNGVFSSNIEWGINPVGARAVGEWLPHFKDGL